VASLPFELKGKTVYVAGHRGMVGSALVRRLVAENVELVTASRREADLRDQAALNAWFAANHVGAVLPLSRSELLRREFNPTAFQAAIRILSEHANGASSTYHA